MKIGKREFHTDKHTYIMGILNVTPDSFSDGGKFLCLDKALFHAEEMIAEGTDILDVGGESSRPGYKAVSDSEEIERVTGVIEGIKSRFDVPISLDTCKGRVAEAGIQAGADMINDIWGLKYDTHMAAVISRSKTACCLMHNRKKAVYDDFWTELKADLRDSLRLAEEAGISGDKIILDPGIGFGKEYEQNMMVLKNLGFLQELGYPLLLGASRKSVIGLTLDLPVTERLEGTMVTTVMAALQGYSFVRVHDIKENVRALKMTEAILYGGNCE